MDFRLEEIMSGSADNHPEVTCIKFPLCFPWPKQTVEGSRHASHKPSGTGLLHVYRTILCWAVLSCFSHVQLFVTPWTVGDFSGKNTAVGCRFLLQGIFPTQGSDPTSPATPALAGRFFTFVLPGKPSMIPVQEIIHVSQGSSYLLAVDPEHLDKGNLHENINNSIGARTMQYTHTPLLFK